MVNGAVEKLQRAGEGPMVDTSSNRDAFARRSAPAGNRFGAGTDHFKRKDGKSGGDHFRSGGQSFDPAKPKKDAFASRGPAKPALAQPAPAKAAAPQPVAPPPAPAPTPVQAPAPEPKRAALHVVASQPEPQPTVDEMMFGRDEAIEAEQRQRRAGRSSSFVLVTGGGPAAASSTETLDAPPPVTEKPVAPPPAAAPPPAPAEPPSRNGGGGDGGSGKGSPASAPVRKRGFSQDDIAGVIFGIAVTIFLLLWLLRGGQNEGDSAASDDPLASTQFAASDTGPPAPFTPQADPFGEAPVDLKPKGPIPEPRAEVAPPPEDAGAADPSSSGGAFASAQVDPASPPTDTAPLLPVEPNTPGTPPPAASVAPATPVMLSKLSSNAWFCTGTSELTEQARADLMKGIETFRPHAGEPLVVHAYADTRGTSLYNLALSGARARVVADFLRAEGLSVIEAEGKGELDGLADNQNCANQRRADIFFESGAELRPSAACLPPPEAATSICR